MHRNEHTIEITRPPATVFPYLTEPEQLKRWVGGLTTFDPVDGESAHVGARSRQVMVIGGKEWKLDGELTALEPDRLVQARMVGKGFAATTSYRLEPLESGTRLTATVESEFSLLVGRLLGALVSREAQKKLRADLARSKSSSRPRQPRGLRPVRARTRAGSRGARTRHRRRRPRHPDRTDASPARGSPCRASDHGCAGRYGRSLVIASSASATAKTRAPRGIWSPARRSG